MDLQALREQLGNLNAIVVGDVMLDRYLFGTVERISPEAPVPIVDLDHEKRYLGGAGNVAANLHAMGVDVTLLGIVGNDNFGALIEDICRKKKIKIELIREINRKTQVKTRVIAEHNQLIRLDRGDYHDVDHMSLTSIAGMITNFYPSNKSFLIISDYMKGTITDAFMKHIRENFKGRIYVDTKRTDWEMFRGCTCITPNEKELGLVPVTLANLIGDCSKSSSFSSWLTNRAERLRIAYKIDEVLITRGKNGLTLVGKTDNGAVPAEAKEVYDVTGAGDTVLAWYAAFSQLGEGKQYALRIANKAAGVVVSKIGTYAPKLEEVITNEAK